MGIPTKHKPVHARVLEYARGVGWTFVLRAETDARRGFDKSLTKPADQTNAAP